MEDESLRKSYEDGAFGSSGVRHVLQNSLPPVYVPYPPTRSHPPELATEFYRGSGGAEKDESFYLSQQHTMSQRGQEMASVSRSMSSSPPNAGGMYATSAQAPPRGLNALSPPSVGSGRSAPGLLHNISHHSASGHHSYAPSGELLAMINKELAPPMGLSGIPGGNMAGMSSSNVFAGQQEVGGETRNAASQFQMSSVDFPALGGGRGSSSVARPTSPLQGMEKQDASFMDEKTDVMSSGVYAPPTGSYSSVPLSSSHVPLQSQPVMQQQSSRQRSQVLLPQVSQGQPQMHRGSQQPMQQQGEPRYFQQQQQQPQRMDGEKRTQSGFGMGEQSMPSGGTADQSPAKFGMEGLLQVIHMTNVDLNTLALGTDLTSLGLNLNSPDSLHSAFASPWADVPYPRDVPFTLPACYRLPQEIPDALSKTQYFSDDTLFYIYYALLRSDPLHKAAIRELYDRGWTLHKETGAWMQVLASEQGGAVGDRKNVRVSMMDVNQWERVTREIMLGSHEAAGSEK